MFREDEINNLVDICKKNKIGDIGAKSLGIGLSKLIKLTYLLFHFYYYLIFF